MKVPAIILAAGASRRLGHPKQLVCIEGETLLARTIRVVREAGVDPVFVVLGANRERIESGIDLSNVRLVVNSAWEQGIATSIHAGIQALQDLDSAANAALLLVCDQPKLTAEHLCALIAVHEQSEGAAIVASRYAGIAGIPAVFPASQFTDLLALRGDTGARNLLRNPKCEVIEIEFAGGGMDIDTPADLAASSSLKLGDSLNDRSS